MKKGTGSARARWHEIVPHVVDSGTWMEDQINGYGNGAEQIVAATLKFGAMWSNEKKDVLMLVLLQLSPCINGTVNLW